MASTHVIKTQQILKELVMTGRRERHLTVKWPSDVLATCPLCNSPIQFKRNGGKRFVQMLQWNLVLRYAYYACTNRTCALHHPFTLPNDIVIPFKHEGRDVWEKVIMLHVEQGAAPDKIVSDLDTNFGFPISAATVARIIETYEILKSWTLDEEALAKIKKAGFIIMAVDGQKPETGKPGLWYFSDVFSKVSLHAEYLTCADEVSLGAIFTGIEERFGVQIKAVLSDHQQSIVNAVAHYLPTAAHQYCHFHFLGNLSEPLEAIDSHLQKTMEIGVRDLYINHANRKNASKLIDGIKEPIRDFFKPIMEDLTRLITNRRKRFDTWAGLASYKNVRDYLPRLQDLLLAMPEGSRAHGILAKSIVTLENLLTGAEPQVETFEWLIDRFDEMRAILGCMNDTAWEMHAKAREWAQEQEWYLHEAGIDIPDEQRRIKKLNYNASIEDVLGQWIHVFNSHEQGLFQFLSMPGLPRSNAGMEREFSTENRFFRTGAGTAMVAHSIRVKGDVVLKILKDREENGSTTGAAIQSVLDMHDIEIVARGTAVFNERRANERKTWNVANKSVHGVDELVERLASIKVNEKA